MSFNGSQYGGCSTDYDTQTSTKVVYNRFGACTSHLQGRITLRRRHNTTPSRGAAVRSGIIAREDPPEKEGQDPELT